MSEKFSEFVKVTGLFLTAALGVASLVISRNAANRADAASHVELGGLTSNSEDYENPWKVWYAPITDRTVVVGLQRWVSFRPQFQNVPEVVTAFRGIDIDTDQDDPFIKWSSQFSSEDQRRLKGAHIVIFTGGISRDGFNVEIGIPVPSDAAPKLRDLLENSPVNTAIFNVAKGSPQLLPGHDTPDKLLLEEKWMMNFYTEVGTFDVVWIATESK